MVNKSTLKRVVKKTHHYSKGPFWFVTGFIIAGITIFSIIMIIYQQTYKDVVIPGVYVDELNVSGKTKEEVANIYKNKNELIKDTTFTLSYEDITATASAQDLGIGYNSELIAEQAAGLGKSSNIFTDIFIAITSYLNGTKLHASYSFNSEKFASIVKPMQEKAYKAPVNAQFVIEDNKVTTFKRSEDGIQLDVAKAQEFMQNALTKAVKAEKRQAFTYTIPVIVLPPEISTEEANSFGIVEEIGSGTSLFKGSIPNRVHNVQLAASRINGILVKPGEEFSFVKNLGDVSKATGYASAYVIQNGRTVLGDGGGVCQVSTTLFRAILNAGLPITERHPHSYRVGYYEQESAPGLDATVFYPSVDLKFKNDTDNYILIQSTLDPVELRLTYTLYGKKDGRDVTVTKPITSGYTPAPEPLNQDDPSLPAGTVKQVEYAAPGSRVVFDRIVKKNGKVIVEESFTSRYTPWRAVFLVGTG